MRIPGERIDISAASAVQSAVRQFSESVPSSVHGILGRWADPSLVTASPEMDAALRGYVDGFLKFFTQEGYVRLPAVPLNSRVDPSVLFIGSHVSVFKPYFLGDEIPGNGICMHQPCLRTWNAKKAFEDSLIPAWWSYFPSIGAFGKPGDTDRSCALALDYFFEVLALPPSEVMVRANSSDKDLMGSLVEYVSATGRNFPIEYDSKPREYYQHKIGLEGIVGRNFNIALRNAATGAFNDVGNVIAIESDSRSYGTEIALGATVILQQTFGLSSMHELGPMAKFSPDIAWLHSKLHDCVVSASAILHCGERPFATTRWRILRTYLRGALYLQKKLRIPASEFRQSVVSYLESTYPQDHREISDAVFAYLANYEKEVFSKRELTSEDEKVRDATLSFPMND